MTNPEHSKSKIPVQQLAIGHFVELPLGWKDHPFMFSNFKIKSQEQLTILYSLGLTEVEINWKKSDKHLKPPVSQDTEPTEQPTVKKTTALTPEQMQQIQSKQLRLDNKRAEAAYRHSLSLFHSAMSKFGLSPEEAYFDIKGLINALCNDVFTSSETKVMHVIQAQPSTDDLFYHSLNVTILCLVVAKELGWSEQEAQLLCLAAFTHDVGLIKVPSTIKRKMTELTKSEENYYKMHSTYSVELIKKANCFPDAILPIIAAHHERLDGSGYPKQATESTLDEMTQLLSLVDAYDSYCFPHPSNKAFTPRNAIALLFKQSQKKFNRAMLEVMVKLLGIYPPGSLVVLSNGAPALVISTNSNNALCPNVLMFESGKNENTGLILNLAKESLDITKGISFDDLEEAPARYFNNHVRYCLYFSPQPPAP
ncbi:DUF3391 domain-containing protein [Motilimonas cestriensis]|uniref:DUF3391 domain-containing protein n=1 Tax=Motilimonas cestriensis TaxID=2742685 RepID=A0ABS8W5L1_9GAMM|nr:DUF3391 domain-containing protein [Motilimonas cestriensis]MCE2593498.1 DUF3391 domain-containing protein [Motilimonas cestriensis]